VQTEEGRILNPTGTPNYEYTLTDHLGNSRVTFDSSSGGAAQQTDDYYPFGLVAYQPSVSSPQNNYLYNKKELQDETGQYDYGARFYDPVIARWTSVDPLAEKSRRFSPYTYGDDNSIINIDPDGMETEGCPTCKIPVMARSSTYVAPKAQPSQVKPTAEKTFPTTDENLSAGVSVSAGYKGFSQKVASKDIPTGSENNKTGPNVVSEQKSDNTASFLAIGGGTKTTTKVITETTDLHDAKGNIIGKNIPLISIVTEKVETMQLGPIIIESREVYVNGQRQVYQGRGGVELEAGKKISAGKAGVGLDGSVTLKTNWSDVNK
jgi:RHS repeat-associated protein